MTYWRLYYHIVWATRDRLPVIDEATEAVVRRVLVFEARERGWLVHGIGVMPDHVHLAISIPPRVAVAEAVRALKSTSSHQLARRSEKSEWCGWQGEYGVLSFGERSLEDVLGYLRDQKAHHAADSIRVPFEIDDRRRM